MTKPRLTRRGLLWTCRAPLRDGIGIGLTPSDAYRNWLLDTQRPHLGAPILPRLTPMQEPERLWPVYYPPVFAPQPAAPDRWLPPYTVTCRH